MVIGGGGLIGSKLVTKLGAHGDDAAAASPNSGINTLAREELADLRECASVVVDLTNSPSIEDASVLEFFDEPGSRALGPFPCCVRSMAHGSLSRRLRC